MLTSENALPNGPIIAHEMPYLLYGYVSAMPGFIAASDAGICTAGGLTEAESLANGLPIILLDALSGQEEGNA